MDLSFDPIPEELWEDWKWFVYPEGFVLGMSEGKRKIESSGVLLTPCYLVNLPKMVMSEVMWASRLVNRPEGMVDTGEHHRPVRLTVDALIDSMIFMLSQYPMVVSKKEAEDAVSSDIAKALEGSEELIIVGEKSEAERTLSSDDLRVEFFNPFDSKDRSVDDMIGMVPPENCIKELSFARADYADSLVRGTIMGAMDELHRRDLITIRGEDIVCMTPKGKSLLDIEPVKDMLSCRCEVEQL